MPLDQRGDGGLYYTALLLKEVSMRKYLMIAGIVLGALLEPIPTESCSLGSMGIDQMEESLIGDLAIDRTADKLYWTYGPNIFRSNLDGSEIEHWAGPLFESGVLRHFFIGIDLEGKGMWISMNVLPPFEPDAHDFQCLMYLLLDDGLPDDYNSMEYCDYGWGAYDYDDGDIGVEIYDRVRGAGPLLGPYMWAFDTVTEDFYWMGVYDGILKVSHIDNTHSPDLQIEIVRLEYDEHYCPIVDMIAHDGRVYWVSQQDQIVTWKWEAKDDGSRGSIVEVIDGNDMANINTAVQGASWGVMKEGRYQSSRTSKGGGPVR